MSVDVLFTFSARSRPIQDPRPAKDSQDHAGHDGTLNVHPRRLLRRFATEPRSDRLGLTNTRNYPSTHETFLFGTENGTTTKSANSQTFSRQHKQVEVFASDNHFTNAETMKTRSSVCCCCCCCCCCC